MTSFVSIWTTLARLTQWALARDALHCPVALSSGCSLGRNWRRRPGRPRDRWTDQLLNDTGLVRWSLPISGDKLYCEDMVVPGVDVLKRLRLMPKLFD